MTHSFRSDGCKNFHTPPTHYAESRWLARNFIIVPRNRVGSIKKQLSGWIFTRCCLFRTQFLSLVDFDIRFFAFCFALILFDLRATERFRIFSCFIFRTTFFSLNSFIYLFLLASHVPLPSLVCAACFYVCSTVVILIFVANFSVLNICFSVESRLFSSSSFCYFFIVFISSNVLCARWRT